VAGYQFLLRQNNPLTCEESRELLIFYESFEYLLEDVPVHTYTFTETDICGLLFCITDALIYLRQHNYHHGDISLSNVCRKGALWKLVDKTFLKNGVTAYERILEG
jgi:serine/threonine protein kinase